jgi:hypothetical protein
MLHCTNQNKFNNSPGSIEVYHENRDRCASVYQFESQMLDIPSKLVSKGICGYVFFDQSGEIFDNLIQGPIGNTAIQCSALVLFGINY